MSRPEPPLPTTPDDLGPAAAVSPPSRPTAPAWRRLTGGAAIAVAAVAGLVAVALSGVSSEQVLVLRGGAVGRPALFGVLLLAGVGTAAGHALSRRPGALRDEERAVACGLALSAVLAAGLVVPLVGFFVLILSTTLADALMAPVPLALVVAGIGGGAAVLGHGAPSVGTPVAWPARRPWASRPGVRRLASTSLTGGVVGLGVLLVGLGVAAAGDEVVVATGPGGCTAVVRQVQSMFTGEVVLFVAPPGNPVAQRVAAYDLEESFPFRTGDGYVLEPGPDEVRIAFDDGLGGVDDVVPCG